ncbi:MAG: hypothetical protein AAGF54_00250 [Pseudomonadota bacterium]
MVRTHTGLARIRPVCILEAERVCKLDIVDYLITYVSELPWMVKGPGFALMVYLIFRSVGQFMTLRWIKAATSLVYALIVALVMARFGHDIAAFIDKDYKPPEWEQSDKAKPA